MPHTVHIIGAGLAGLAAAVKLTQARRDVTLYEAAPFAGGRCRSYHDAALSRIIDNGNHLILGANRHALAYIDLIGSRASFIAPPHARYDFIDLAGGQPFRVNPLWALQAFARLAFAGRASTVSAHFKSTRLLYRRFVEPFCTSALNTLPAEASAALLRRTLAEILKCGPRGLRYYLPQHSLAASLIDPALALIKNVHYGSALKSLEWADGKVTALHFEGRRIETKNDAVILATPAHVAAKLLPQAGIEAAYNPIVNGHFLCPDIGWSHKADFIGITGGTAQWIFHRAGLLSTTTSAANGLADNDSLPQRLWSDICKALRVTLPLPPHRIIIEKRATRAATPASLAPLRTRYGNLLLAGDYTQTQMPATIDSAVKSGFDAARRLYFGFAKISESGWCGREDLNLHGLPH